MVPHVGTSRAVCTLSLCTLFLPLYHYIGKSVIIQCAIVFVFMLAALLFSLHHFAWFPSYYFQAGLMLLGPFRHHCLSINRGHSDSFLHPIRGAFNGLLLSSRVFIEGQKRVFSSQCGNDDLLQQSVCNWVEN